jgi:hypothetical protein
MELPEDAKLKRGRPGDFRHLRRRDEAVRRGRRYRGEKGQGQRSLPHCY